MPTLTERRQRGRHAVASFRMHAALDIGTATDVGRVRAANEDALLAVLADGAREGQVLVAVADGMGGHKAGEVASALAVESLQRTFQEVDASETPQDLLTHALQRGNQTIWEAAAEDVEKEGMGTTLVCALLTADGQAVIANVGDSRAYAFSAGEAVLVTVDHTWVNQQVLAGQMSEREARHSPESADAHAGERAARGGGPVRRGAAASVGGRVDPGLGWGDGVSGRVGFFEGDGNDD